MHRNMSEEEKQLQLTFLASRILAFCPNSKSTDLSEDISDTVRDLTRLDRADVLFLMSSVAGTQALYALAKHWPGEFASYCPSGLEPQELGVLLALDEGEGSIQSLLEGHRDRYMREGAGPGREAEDHNKVFYVLALKPLLDAIGILAAVNDSKQTEFDRFFPKISDIKKGNSFLSMLLDLGEVKDFSNTEAYRFFVRHAELIKNAYISRIRYDKEFKGHVVETIKGTNSSIYKVMDQAGFLEFFDENYEPGPEPEPEKKQKPVDLRDQEQGADIDPQGPNSGEALPDGGWGKSKDAPSGSKEPQRTQAENPVAKAWHDGVKGAAGLANSMGRWFSQFASKKSKAENDRSPGGGRKDGDDDKLDFGGL